MAQVNYVRDVQPFDDSQYAFSNPVIADELNGQTINPISSIDAAQFFAYFDWWYQSSPGNYEGELQLIVVNPATPADTVATLNELWSLVFGGSSQDCGTTLLQRNGQAIKKQFAAKLKAALDYAVTASGSITQEELDDFYSIGGRKYPGTDPVTGPNVATSRDEYEAEQALEQQRDEITAKFNSQYNTYFAPMLVTNPDNAAAIAALQQMAATWPSD